MNLKKKLVFKFNRTTEVLPIHRMERIYKITEMVNQGKTDGKLVQTFYITTDNYEDQSLVSIGHRLFRDQEAAEEFKTWWLSVLAEYNIYPESISIVDVD
jgi:hypothetical protein